MARGRSSRALLVAALLAPVLVARGAAAADPPPEIAVVVAPDAPHIVADLSDLREIFLKRRVIDAAGEALVPVNLPADDPLRIAFSRVLLGKDPAEWQRYWSQRYFHGISPPYVLRSEEAVLRFVARTPGAVGYVSACHADARVRVIARLAVPPALAPELRDRCRSPASAAP